MFLGMPKVAKELSALAVKRLKSSGLHFVGGVAGLILQIKNPLDCEKPPSRSWILRTRFGAERLHMGLGPYPEVSLAEAREKARKLLARCREGVNPVKERKAERSALIASAGKAKTFRECAETYLEIHLGEFSNKKHRQQWRSTLKTYAHPVIGNMLVSDITKENVLEVLNQNVEDPTNGTIIGKLWGTKMETASRLRGRIKVILNYAMAMNYRQDPNPATWTDCLQTLLKSPYKNKAVKHQPAIPYDQTPKFMVQLRKNKSISARALEFLILTAVRSGSVRLATWNEINFRQKLWEIPAAHTKARERHRVPLSPQAVALLKKAPRIAGCEVIFPSPRLNSLSDMALSQLMRGMRERGELKLHAVPHGFRSSFRDWSADQTGYPDEIRKAASGHAVRDPVKEAYQHTDLLEKRRALMNDWAKFLDSKSKTKRRNAPKRKRAGG
jgi:integrase